MSQLRVVCSHPASWIRDVLVSPHEASSQRCSLGLHSGNDMGVLLHRERGALVAEPFADDLDRYLCSEGDCRVRGYAR